MSTPEVQPMRKFLMDELKKSQDSLKKYEDAYLGKEENDKEFLKESIAYYRTQVTDLRLQIAQTRTTP